ncbi:hypothetical protein [Brevibacterium sp. S111]|uniref:hypothetical protein n=1 Tax=Brevibacterium sp. S111 TaxID=2483795 RepID=UPI001F10488E|nr:hypothetical protein [Brevibacterium sp. S111]
MFAVVSLLNRIREQLGDLIAGQLPITVPAADERALVRATVCEVAGFVLGQCFGNNNADNGGALEFEDFDFISNRRCQFVSARTGESITYRSGVEAVSCGEVGRFVDAE